MLKDTIGTVFFHRPLTEEPRESLNIMMRSKRFSLGVFPKWSRFSWGALSLLLLITLSCSSTKEAKPEEPFNPEKSLARANELIEEKNYDEARKILLEVKNRDVTKKYAPLAQLRIADSYTREDDVDLAVAEYKSFLEIYPDHKSAPYAQYEIAMAYFGQIAGPEQGYGAAAKALEEFEKLKRLYPRNPYKEVIDIKIDQCKNTMADYEFLVGEFYFNKASYNAALKRLQDLLLKFPEYKKESLVLYHIALCYKNTGNKDKAIEYFTRLVEKYPNDVLVKEAKKEIASISK